MVSQEVKAVFGTSPVGHLGFYVVQLATMLILYTGGNTSFNGFPYLASFVAGDRFLPRQLTRRGHRLAFSNGIIVLTAVALALILVYKAQVNGLVALYAIGVFTGFTMAGLGHGQAPPDPARGAHWRRSVAINGFSAFLSFVVVLIFAVAKFKEGAWLIVVVGPLLYIGLIRLHRQYIQEAEMLETGVVEACEAPVLRRHVVVVLVDRLDMATARALQYARDAGARRPAGGALRHRHQGGPRARGGVEPARSGPPAPRHHRVPGPPARAGPRSSWWPTPRSTATPSARCSCRAAATPGSGSASCTTARRTRSPPSWPSCPTSARPSSPSPWAPDASASGSAPTAGWSSSGPPGGRRRRRCDGGGTVDAEARTGVDRLGRKDGPKRAGVMLAADATLALRAGATTPIASVVPRQRCGWPAG